LSVEESAWRFRGDDIGEEGYDYNAAYIQTNLSLIIMRILVYISSCLKRDSILQAPLANVF
jgi:hypothetical protein